MKVLVQPMQLESHGLTRFGVVLDGVWASIWTDSDGLSPTVLHFDNREECDARWRVTYDLMLRNGMGWEAREPFMLEVPAPEERVMGLHDWVREVMLPQLVF